MALFTLTERLAARGRIHRDMRIIRLRFDPAYYLVEYPDLQPKKTDPLQHFCAIGWREGRNPTSWFNTQLYLDANPDVRARQVNPFAHYLEYGAAEGRSLGHSEADPTEETDQIEEPDPVEEAVQDIDDHVRTQIEACREEFDQDFYEAQYPDVAGLGEKCIEHYFLYGWREARNPAPWFDTSAYLLAYPDVAASPSNPFYHFIAAGRQERRKSTRRELAATYFGKFAPHGLQDMTFPKAIEQAERLIVVVVPELDTMNGGIYSLFSIAQKMYELRSKHGYRVVVMTRPNVSDLTYIRQRNFRNFEDVYRFSQICECKNLQELYLLIPEYAASSFYSDLSTDIRDFLREVPSLNINIMNQNIELMPDRDDFLDLMDLYPDDLTQSVAHHSYFSQDFADKYSLKTLLLPAHTDLSNYPKTSRDTKEKIIIYSPDEEREYFKDVLEAVRVGLPDYQLVKIEQMTFDTFMEYATNCMFSITFGEGFDGYLALPTCQGGIGFSCYREEFFPDAKMKDFENIFASEDDMISGIVARIRKFESDVELFQKTNDQMMEIYNTLYSLEEYEEKVLKLVRKEFEIFPGLHSAHVFSNG